MISLCQPVSFEQGQSIYEEGAPSEDVLVLLQGALDVLSPNGTVLHEIRSGSCVGEVGVFSERPRIASIVANCPSGGVTLRRVDIEHLRARNARTYALLARNALRILCMRLSDADLLVDAPPEQPNPDERPDEAV